MRRLGDRIGWECIGAVDILVQLSPADPARLGPQVDYALALATALQGRVTALVFEIEMHAGEEEDEAERESQGETTAAQTVTREALEERARAQAVDVEIVTGRNYAFTILETLADYARLSDIVVVATDGPLVFPRRHLAEYTLFETGRPILLVPAHAKPALDHVVVAWDASRAATRALHDAMPLLRAAGEVSVVTVGEGEDAPAGRSGPELCRRLAHRGVRARFHDVAREGRPAGACLMEFCATMRADMLVMGAQRHSRLRDLVYGSATSTVFDQGPRLPVFMAN